ncbi:hypothetical protein [Lysobacter sp. HA35]
MSRLLIAFASLLVAAPSLAAPPLQINAEDHGAGRFRVRATVPDTTDVQHAQALLAPAFAQLCQGARVTLGHYTFEGSEPLTGKGSKQLMLAQDVQCGDSPPLVHDSAERPAPTARDEARVRSNMLDYLKARDAGDRAMLASIYSSEMKRALLNDGMIKASVAFRDAAGGPGAPRLSELDWQDDPEGTEPGRYVAVDYIVDYPNGAVSCGYVGWRQLSPELYEIIRVEQGDLERTALDAIPVADRDAARRKIGCRD